METYKKSAGKTGGHHKGVGCMAGILGTDVLTQV